MVFGDDDLKRLKNEIDWEDYVRITWSSDKLTALLARLGAAEILASRSKHLPDCIFGGGQCGCGIEAWRKAAGK